MSRGTGNAEAAALSPKSRAAGLQLFNLVPETIWGRVAPVTDKASSMPLEISPLPSIFPT